MDGIAPKSPDQDLGVGVVRISYTGAERKESRKRRSERQEEAERKRKEGGGVVCRLWLTEPAPKNRSLQTGLGSPKPGCLGWHPEGAAWPSTEPLGAA